MLKRILLFTAAILLAPSDATAQARKPNIIVILADDLGYADLSCQGSKDIKTPHIDSLAKNGTRFTSAYVSAPYCSPTRAGLLTGRYQQRFGHEFNPLLLKNGGQGQGLPLDQRTIADLMRLAGYTTGLIGKWHLGEEAPYHPQARGFEEFFGFLTGAHSYLESDDKNYGPVYRGKKKVELDGYLTDIFAKEATQFIDRHKAKPFFLYLAFNAVHTPMHAPKDAEREFANIKDEKRRTYLAMTRKLDDAVGAILAKLRELNLEEDTLIFFLSDNGGPTTKFAPNGSYNFPLRGSKGDTWEGGIRVPFIIQWKGHVPANKTDDRPIISLDILPTSLAAAQFTRKAQARSYQHDADFANRWDAAQTKHETELKAAHLAKAAWDKTQLRKTLLPFREVRPIEPPPINFDRFHEFELNYAITQKEKKVVGAVDGVNLLPFIDGTKADMPHAALYWRFGSQMAIRKGDWVLVKPSMGTKEYENIAKTAMLFNITKDIGQEKDLAAQHPERAREMQAEWDRWNATLIAPRWPATFKGAPFKNP